MFIILSIPRFKNKNKRIKVLNSLQAFLVVESANCKKLKYLINGQSKGSPNGSGTHNLEKKLISRVCPLFSYSICYFLTSIYDMKFHKRFL
jgi:hypothetical protein